MRIAPDLGVQVAGSASATQALLHCVGRRPGALDLKRHLCGASLMPATLEQVTKEAMGLSPHQKLALAAFLLESADATTDPRLRLHGMPRFAQLMRAVLAAWRTRM